MFQTLDGKSVDDEQTPWAIVLLLWLVGISAAMQFAKYSIGLNALNQVYQDGEVYNALLLSSVGVVGVIFGASASMVAVRLGLKNSLIMALIIGSICAFVQFLLPSYPLMLLSRIIEGGSHVIIAVVAPTLIAMISAPRHRSIAMGIWATFFSVAYSLMGWLGVDVINNFGVAALFGGHSAIMALLVVAVLLLVPNYKQENADVEPFSFKVWLNTHRVIYSSIVTALPGIAFLFNTIMTISLLTYLPQFSENPVDQKYLAIILPILGIMGSLLAGFIVQRLQKPLRLQRLFFIVLIPMVLLSWISQGTSYYFIACAIMMMGYGCVQGGTFAIVPQLCDNDITRARANGVIAQMGNLGSFLGTPVFALLIAAWGFSSIMIFCIILSVMAVVSLSYFKMKLRSGGNNQR